MKIKMNQIALYMLGVSLLAQPKMVYAEEQLEILTLDMAIKSATDTSTTLKLHERNIEYMKENVDMAKLTGGYYAYNAANVEYKYIEKQEDVIKDNIILSVTQIFDTILYVNEQLAHAENNIELQEKQLLKNTIQHEKGLQSDIYMEEINLTLLQLNQQKEVLLKAIDDLYTQLSALVGKETRDYVLERESVIYEPYKAVEDVTAYAEDVAEDHIEVWKASEDLRIALETPIMTQDYMTMIEKKKEREDNKDLLEQTEENLVIQIESVYNEMKTLEEEYLLKEKDLLIKEKEQVINSKYLEAGMLSQLDFDLQAASYEAAKLELKQMANEHSYLKYKLQHPHLID